MTQDTRLCHYCGEANERLDPRAIFCSVRCKERSRDKKRRADPAYRAAKSAYYREYSEINRERLRLKSEAWNHANRELHRELSLRWWNANKHSSPESWRSKNLPAAASKERARTKRLREATPFPLDHDAVLAKVAYWGGKCWMCGGAFESIDHVKPISRGGLNILANIRPACVSCNSRKRNSWGGPHALSMFIRQ